MAHEHGWRGSNGQKYLYIEADTRESWGLGNALTNLTGKRPL